MNRILLAAIWIFQRASANWAPTISKRPSRSELGDNESDLPLQELCESGGVPDWEDIAEFNLGAPEERGDLIILTGDVWFNESIPSGCRDMNWHETRRGRIFVEIDKKSGRANVSVERVEREERNLENY